MPKSDHKESQNIAVIGAGIMGLSAAYALSQIRHKITLYDPKGFPADNASFMAGGMLAPYAEIEHMPQDFIQAGLEGIRLWQEIAPEHIKQNGSLLIAHEEDRYILERFKSHLALLETEDKTSPSDFGLYKIKGVGELEPALAARFCTGLHLKEEAHLNPAGALSTLFELCKIKQGRGIALHRKGCDPEGISSQYDLIIDCRGMGAADDDRELRGVKGEILIVENKEFVLSRPVRLMHPRYPLYIVPRADNIFMIGATNIESADNHVTVRSGLELMSALYSLHPSFSEARIVEMKAGIRPAYPDNLPRIKIKGSIIHCNGLFRHGYLLAPVMAECVADYINGKENKFMHLFKGDKNDPDHQWREKEFRSAA